MAKIFCLSHGCKCGFSWISEEGYLLRNAPIPNDSMGKDNRKIEKIVILLTIEN